MLSWWPLRITNDWDPCILVMKSFATRFSSPLCSRVSRYIILCAKLLITQTSRFLEWRFAKVKARNLPQSGEGALLGVWGRCLGFSRHAEVQGGAKGQEETRDGVSTRFNAACFVIFGAAKAIRSWDWGGAYNIGWWFGVQFVFTFHW